MMVPSVKRTPPRPVFKDESGAAAELGHPAGPEASRTERGGYAASSFVSLQAIINAVRTPKRLNAALRGGNLRLGFGLERAFGHFLDLRFLQEQIKHLGGQQFLLDWAVTVAFGDFVGELLD